MLPYFYLKRRECTSLSWSRSRIPLLPHCTVPRSRQYFIRPLQITSQSFILDFYPLWHQTTMISLIILPDNCNHCAQLRKLNREFDSRITYIFHNRGWYHHEPSSQLFTLESLIFPVKFQIFNLLAQLAQSPSLQCSKPLGNF